MKLGVPWIQKGTGRRGSASPMFAEASVHARLDDLTRQLERLSRITDGRLGGSGAVRSPRPAPIEVQPVARNSVPESTPAANREIHTEDSEARVAHEIARYAGDRKLNRNPLKATYGARELERTIAEIAVRQRALDTARRVPADPLPRSSSRATSPPTQDLSGLEQQLRHITTQLESLRRPSGAEEAVPKMRQELSELSRMLAEAMPQRAIEALDAHIRSLADRVDQIRHEGTAEIPLSNIERHLADVREALRSLAPAESLVGLQNDLQHIARKIDALPAGRQDPAVLQQLESAITGLRSIVAHVASDDALGRLTDEIRALAAKLDRTAGEAPVLEAIQALDHRVGAMAREIEQSKALGRQVPAQIETLLLGLGEKIEQFQLNRADPIAIDQLEAGIAKLVDRLDTSDTQLSHIEMIERGLTDMLHHLDRTRSGGEPSGALSDADVEALKRDVQAVNTTLAHVVERLATIELGIREPPRPAVTVPQVNPVAPPLRSDKPLSERLAAAAAAQRPRPEPRNRAPIDPSLPPDHPLEPRAGASRSKPSAADRIAASEAALGPARPPVIPDPGGQSGFIAAARRAAQMSARSPDARQAAAVEFANPSLRERFTGRMRSLIIGTGVVLVTVAALPAAMMMFDGPPTYMRAGGKLAQQSSSQALSTRGGNPPGVQHAAAPPRIEPKKTRTADARSTPPLPQSPKTVTAALPGWVASVDTRAPESTGSIPHKPAANPTPAAVPLPPKHSVANHATDALASAAVAGNPAAAYQLGMRYFEGSGVSQSYETAAHWLERAAAHGLAPAQFRLATLYQKGLGVKKNLETARRLYADAAAKGNAKAMHNLAVLYANGVVGKPDYHIAAQWFRKAAERGIADSQYNLGVLCARGIGVERNLIESYKWFALAAQQGDKDAAKKRDEVAALLDTKSLAAAQHAVKTFAVLPQPQNAEKINAPVGGPRRSAKTPALDRNRPAGQPVKLGPA